MKILLVEDEPLWQQGVAQLVTLVPGASMVAVADNYTDAVDAYDKYAPDVVLLDWNLPGEKDGIDVGQYVMEKGHLPERMLLVSGANPESIPPIPYRHIPKSMMASQLLQALQDIQAALTP